MESALPAHGILTTQLQKVVNWARRTSLWPMPFATACCGIELMATASSRFDLARFGAEVMRFSPRQSDLLIVAGRVAIKMMHRDITSDPDQLERFRREARAVAQLNHPHVVTVIDAGEDDGTPYIVLEYVEGETLKDRIRRMGRLPVSEAVVPTRRCHGKVRASARPHRPTTA